MAENLRHLGWLNYLDGRLWTRFPKPFSLIFPLLRRDEIIGNLELEDSNDYLLEDGGFIVLE